MVSQTFALEADAEKPLEPNTIPPSPENKALFSGLVNHLNHHCPLMIPVLATLRFPSTFRPSQGIWRFDQREPWWPISFPPTGGRSFVPSKQINNTAPVFRDRWENFGSLFLFLWEVSLVFFWCPCCKGVYLLKSQKMKAEWIHISSCKASEILLSDHSYEWTPQALQGLLVKSWAFWESLGALPGDDDCILSGAPRITIFT